MNLEARSGETLRPERRRKENKVETDAGREGVSSPVPNLPPQQGRGSCSGTGWSPQRNLLLSKESPGFCFGKGNYPSCNACKITVYFIFLKNSSDKCPLPMVSIKCQSQYNAPLLGGCSLTVTRAGAGEPQAAPLQRQGPRPLPCRPSRGPHSRLRRGSCHRALPPGAAGPADGPGRGG